MNRSIEQVLLSLMPTQASAPPQPLVDLASSLLAQSRHRASTLKADEEIARLYACANIACDRLKTSLNLPPIEPRPPIAPRLYKKLYAHLDQVLPSAIRQTSSGRIRTPSSKLREAEGSPASGSRPLPSKATPTKERSLSQFRTGGVSAPDPATPTKSTGRRRPPVDRTALHPWIGPTARHVCRATDDAALAPTVLAGMESIVAPGGKRTKDEWTREHLTALLGAVYYVAATQVKRLRGTAPAKVDRESYVPARKQIVAALSTAREEVDIRGADEGEFWEGWHDMRAPMLDEAIKALKQRGWTQMDWYAGIGDVVARQGKAGGRRKSEAGRLADGEEDEQEDEQPGDQSEEGIQVRRADTMFQDRYDYLSRSRLDDYEAWKEGVLRRIEELEANGPDAMEVDS